MLLPKHYKAPGGSPTARKVHATDTDDFVTPDQIKAQVAAFNEYEGVIPSPSGWSVMILTIALPETTEGGLIMEDMYREQKTKSSPQGIVLGLGSGAYNPDDARFPNGPWCKVGDRVLFGRYTGKAFKLANGQELAFLVDTDIIAVVETGWLNPVEVDHVIS